MWIRLRVLFPAGMRFRKCSNSPGEGGVKRSWAKRPAPLSPAPPPLLPKLPKVVLTFGSSLAIDGGRMIRPSTYLRSSTRLFSRESWRGRCTSPHSDDRADVGDHLLDVEAVGPPEQAEDAVRLVRGDWQGAAARVVAGHDRGHGATGEVGDRGVVLIPGGLPGQLGEVGEALRVDLPLAVEQRRGRELVEDHLDHRASSRARRTPRALALLCGRISFEVSLKKKKMTRKTTGATASTSSRLGTKRVLRRP